MLRLRVHLRVGCRASYSAACGNLSSRRKQVPKSPYGVVYLNQVDPCLASRNRAICPFTPKFGLAPLSSVFSVRGFYLSPALTFVGPASNIFRKHFSFFDRSSECHPDFESVCDQEYCHESVF